MDRERYVYLHARPCGEVFYVGKGTGRRAYWFNKNRSIHYRRLVAKIGPASVSVTVLPCEDDRHALEMERDIIELLKKAGHRLVNKTDGGEGVPGYTHTAETRAKISAANIGRKLSAAHREKMSEAHRGRVFSLVTRQKISQALTGRKRPPSKRNDHG